MRSSIRRTTASPILIMTRSYETNHKTASVPSEKRTTWRIDQDTAGEGHHTVLQRPRILIAHFSQDPQKVPACPLAHHVGKSFHVLNEAAERLRCRSLDNGAGMFKDGTQPFCPPPPCKRTDGMNDTSRRLDRRFAGKQLFGRSGAYL